MGAAVWGQLDPGVPGSLLSRFDREVGEANTARAQSNPRVAAKQAALGNLRMYVSHFHQVLDMGITRGRWEPGVRVHYGRPAGAGTLPALATEQQVEEAGAAIVNGEALRLAAQGPAFVAMANPSAGEVGSMYSEFRGAKMLAATAQATASGEAEDVADLTEEAVALAEEVFDTVEFFFRKERDGATFRRKCREWGVEYVYSEGETPDEPLPGAPGAMSVVQGAAGTRELTFSWGALAGATGFRLYGQGPGAAAPVLLAQVSATQAVVVVDNATSGEDWIFTLKAVNDTGEGPAGPALPAALP